MRLRLKDFALAHPRLTAWIICVLILSLWGRWAGPGWNPQPLRAQLLSETSATAVTTGSPTPRLGTYGVQIEAVDIPLRDGTMLTATLRRPAAVDEAAPGVLFIHGTGTDSHTDFYREAQSLSSAGIITLVPDKRIDDYTLTHRDYFELAEDFEDAFSFLISLEGVDPHRSGIYGVSEGCFIAPIVATQAEGVAEVVLVSAPVLPIREQGALAADTYLRELGVPEVVLRAIPRLMGQQFAPDTFDYIDFDASEYQKQMVQPVLMAYGTGDMSMPIVQAPLALRDDLAEAGNEQLTVRYYEGADHGLQIGEHALLLSAMQDISDWVNGMPFTATSNPHVAGAQPSQAYVADTVVKARWFASGRLALAILIIGGVLTILGAAVALLASRILARRGIDAPRTRPLVWASAIVIALVLALLAYMVAVAYLATNYEHNDWIVRGGWLALRLLALYAAWAILAPIMRTQERLAPRPTRILGAVTSLGQVSLLLGCAYWGVYPALI